MNMTPYDARMQVVHDCPYSRLTQKYPEAVIAMWCDRYSHVFEIRARDSETMQGVEEELNKLGHRQSVIREEGMMRIVAKDCDCGPGVSSMIAEEGVWSEEPVIYKDGWEHYHLIAHDKDSFTRLVKRIEKAGGAVKLTSLKPLRLRGIAEDMILTSSSILAGLTDKQMRVLAQACMAGYFEEPTRIDLDTLARQAHLSRSTYAEHLRKAQFKLLANLRPTIQLAAETAKG